MENETRINVQEIMAEIRRRAAVRKARGEAVPDLEEVPDVTLLQGDEPIELYDLRHLRQEVATANNFHAAVGTINPRRPGLHNKAIQFVKKVMRRMLTWYTRPLHEFHRAVAGSLNEVVKACENSQADLKNLEANLTVADVNFARFVNAERARIRKEFATLEERLRANERHIRRVEQTVHSGAPAGASSAAPPMFPTAMNSETNFDYFTFEEQFRGPEEQIKQRQLDYVEYFRTRQNVLDLGCGRGEFLELLRESGVPARGVETGVDAFLRCRDKGLDVVQQDLFTFLESQPDQSVGGIFCSQVIEHLPSGLQIRLVNLASQKLGAGAPLIIETINPECLYALSRNFFLDPTHVRPVHPEMLAFLMKSLAFDRVVVKFSSPAPGGPLPKLDFPQPQVELERFNSALEYINRALFGFQDYAAIGVR